jgi:hypothetical protein
MSQTVQISDDLFGRLTQSARQRGLSIEQLLADWQRREDELQQRTRIVNQIQSIRERLYARSGEQPDSVEHIRADRMRP